MFPRQIVPPIISLTLLCLSVIVADGKEKTATPKPSLTAEDQRLFAWFDRLDVEDLRPARLVRVRTGSVNYVGHERLRQADEPRGFLLWENDRQFRALLGDLTVATFDKAGTSPRDDDYVGWREVSPAAEAGALLRTLGKKEL